MQFCIYRDHYGKEIVRVELGKTEVRSRKADWMRMSKFLDSYPHDDLYLVHSLSGKMLGMRRLHVSGKMLKRRLHVMGKILGTRRQNVRYGKIMSPAKCWL